MANQPSEPSKVVKQTCCGRCGQQGHYPKCFRCRDLAYCSKECQRDHWPIHKLECAEMANTRPLHVKFKQWIQGVVQSELRQYLIDQLTDRQVGYYAEIRDLDSLIEQSLEEVFRPYRKKRGLFQPKTETQLNQITHQNLVGGAQNGLQQLYPVILVKIPLPDDQSLFQAITLNAIPNISVGEISRSLPTAGSVRAELMRTIKT